MIVGLRHDVDTVYGLKWGLPKIISVEKNVMLGLPSLFALMSFVPIRIVVFLKGLQMKVGKLVCI